MRIDKLTLKRFGSFTDKTIDFGAADTEFDLHLIYGPNEAGKSTLRSAVESFLYGIPLRTSYDFLHDSKALQIEAAVSLGSQRHELIRVKRNANSLLSAADNQPVGDDLLRPLLGGVDRDAYVNIFSMDEDSLELGGNSILDSEGDLGELLFSSTSGIAALGEALAKVRAEADGFYKPRSRQVRLKQKAAGLKALREQVKQLDVSAHTYAARKKAKKEAFADYDAATQARAQHEHETKRLKALLDCVELWSDYQACEQQIRSTPSLPSLPSLPTLPEGWLQRGQTLAQRSASTDARIEHLQKNIDAERLKKSSLEPNTMVLDQAPKIDRLSADDTEARFRAAANAEEMLAEIKSLDEQIQRSLKTLRPPPGTNADDLPLPAARLGQISALTEQYAVLETLMRAATEEQVRADDAHRVATAEHQKLGDVRDLSEVERLIVLLREDGLENELARQNDELKARRKTLDQALLDLEPWRGGVEELRALVVPIPGELTQLDVSEREHEAQVRVLETEQHRLEADVARCDAELNALRTRGGLVDDTAAAQLRQRRDAHWREHRETLVAQAQSKDQSAVTADRFETLLAEDDALQATRFDQASELAELRNVELQRARAAAKLEHIEAKTQARKNLQSEFTQSLRQLCEGLSLPTGMAPVAIEAWLARRTHTLVAAQNYAENAADIDCLEKQIAKSLASLQGALASAEISAGTDSLRETLQLADQAVRGWRERQQKLNSTLAAMQASQQELDLRSKRLSEANTKLAEWQTQWEGALAGLWLVVGSRIPAVAEVSEILRVLDKLSALLDKRNDASAAMSAMQHNRELYIAEVSEIAQRLSVPMNSDRPLETADELRRQLAEARDAQQRLTEIDEALGLLGSQLSAAQAIQAESQAEFEEMTEIFPADSTAELLAQMQRAQTQMQVRDRCEALKRQLTKLLGVSGFDEAKVLLTEQLADQEAIDALGLAHSAAEANGVDLGDRVSRLYHQWQAAKEALDAIGADDEVAVLNEKIQVQLEDIRADTQRFIELSAGTLVVERALRTYLDKHRSTMLTRASSAFATITRGAFTSLDAMPGIVGKSKEELVGIRRDGSSTAAKEMSRGSRFQLYLSLRIAGYHEFVAAREPLPFFADDILETFDDDRSAETFGLMAEMSKSGQVIYLTHHEHLCDIANRVTGGRVKIHELPARSMGEAASE